MGLLQPLEREDLDESGRVVWDKISTFGPIVPKVKMLAHHPTVLDAYWDLGIAANAEPDLPAPIVHLIVMRTSVLDRCAYGWRQRVPKALATGLDRRRIDELKDWQDSSAYNDDERLVLGFVDTVHRGEEIPDAMGAAMLERFPSSTVLGLTILTLYYEMSHALMDLLGIVPESTDEPLPWEEAR